MQDKIEEMSGNIFSFSFSRNYRKMNVVRGRFLISKISVNFRATEKRETQVIKVTISAIFTVS